MSEILINSIAGQTTTAIISASAGPIQGSAFKIEFFGRRFLATPATFAPLAPTSNAVKSISPYDLKSNYLKNRVLAVLTYQDPISFTTYLLLICYKLIT